MEGNKRQRAPRRVDHTGERFGSLVVLRPHDSGPRAKWVCACDCGGTADVLAANLTAGRTTSCRPCARKRQAQAITRHGESRSRIYKIWADMLNRCRNANLGNHKYYGAKGISVCGEWQDFASFYAWAHAAGYTDDLTIDRIDSGKDYTPENCRWLSKSENSRLSATQRHAKEAA